MERRDVVKLLATLPLGAWVLTAEGCADAAEQAVKATAGGAVSLKDFEPEFFTPLEWRTVLVLADIVIPRDERSGSATEAGVPQFMDFVMINYTGNQARMRDGLGWLNNESRNRFGKPFPDITDPQRIEIVEDIAWPAKANPGLDAGVRFFSAFRDLTASGFFSSRIGVTDLGYIGNVPRAAWDGCPPEVLKHIGVS